MAGMGVYKLYNEGESSPSNCFPAESFFHQNREGAGHWLVAPRSHVGKSYKKIPKRQKSEELFCTTLPVRSESKKLELKRLKEGNNTLNGQLLMTVHCVDKPSDLCSVDISEKKLHSLELEGLEEFDNVAYINASDNCLPLGKTEHHLEPFTVFPALRELELSLNGLCTLEIHAADFPRLEVLDLSYNNLSADGILAVGLLSRLKVLHLTGNNLHMLPPNMAGPYTSPEKMAPQSTSLFQSLEVLMLDDNKLSSPGVFSSLANLRRLQHLNLKGNYVSEVPYLAETQLPSSSVLEPESATEDAAWTKYLGSSDPQVDQQEFVNQVVDEDKGARMFSKDFCPPFPRLRHLNLASNKITEEESLLAVALFPMISELVIHSNPLTTQKSGDPPVLTRFLQDRLGIKIRRKNITDTVARVMLPVNPKRKIKTKIPNVPKVPLTTATLCVTESPCTQTGNKNSSPLPLEFRLTDELFPCSSQTSTEEREEDIAAANRSEVLEDTAIPNEPQKTEEPFFVTEVNDLHGCEYQEAEEMLRKDTKDCPERFKGYEELLDDNLDFDMPESTGIQYSVKVLEHTLKNLLVYRDSKANLDHLQTPCRKQQKRIKNLPPLKPCKSKGEKVKEILIEMKERKAISEIPLDSVLGGKDICRKEYEEALSLLKDVKKKYKMVQLKAVEQAAQIESISHKNGT